MCKISIKLTNGKKINLELYPEVAPISVENFLKLVDDNYFDGICFHRCIKSFMIQGGGFTQDGNAIKEKKSAKSIKGEFKNNGVTNTLHHGVGVISMARTTAPNSASSQFFLCVGDCAFLDNQYAGFGKTTDDESNEVIKAISNVETHSYSYFDDIPNEAVVIKTIVRL